MCFSRMIELPHTLVGVAIATKLNNPALALPLAFASHFVLDLLPHWNPHLNREMKVHGKITKRTTSVIAVDVLISLAAGFSIAYFVSEDIGHFALIVAAAFFAVLPDAIEAPYFFFGWRIPFLRKWVGLQSKLQFNIPIFPGILTQVLIVVAALLVIFS